MTCRWLDAVRVGLETKVARGRVSDPIPRCPLPLPGLPGRPAPDLSSHRPSAFARRLSGCSGLLACGFPLSDVAALCSENRNGFLARYVRSMRRALAGTVICSALLLANVTLASAPPTTPEGLVRVPSKNLGQVYLQPGVDFDHYTQVIVEPTEVAFANDWQQNFNDSVFGNSRVSTQDLRMTISEAVKSAHQLFTEAWARGGYGIAQAPGPEVMQVRTAVTNISVSSPDTPTSGRSHSFVREAGRATFVVEVRDSMTGALLGRGIDQRLVGNDLNTWRTRVSNRADFRREVERWAELSVRGINEIKAKGHGRP
jgi:hypothetical protein